ncbi:MAG: phosphotransferase, partial [Oscillospiraceae bacterium]|nr:phosphotransferase [Oscillospiraceae bacterium]
EYISSAGLRVLLKLKKLVKNVSLIELSSEIYEIFEVTGFTEMMDVQRAYRRFDVTGLEQIASGNMGTIYRLTDDEILKVFRPNIGVELIDETRRKTKSMFLAGIPTMIAFDVVKVGDCFGVIYEMLGAVTLDKFMNKSPENLETGIDVLVDLYRKLGTTEAADDIPSFNEELMKDVPRLAEYLDENEFAVAKKLATMVPEAKTLVHGDLHSRNAMMTDNGAMLIDLDDTCAGHPIWDVGSLAYLHRLRRPEYHEGQLKSTGLPLESRNRLVNEFVRKYLNVGPDEDLDELVRELACFGVVHFLVKNLYTTPELIARTVIIFKDIIAGETPESVERLSALIRRVEDAAKA